MVRRRQNLSQGSLAPSGQEEAFLARRLPFRGLEPHGDRETACAGKSASGAQRPRQQHRGTRRCEPRSDLLQWEAGPKCTEEEQTRLDVDPFRDGIHKSGPLAPKENVTQKRGRSKTQWRGISRSKLKECSMQMMKPFHPLDFQMTGSTKILSS